MKPSSRQYKEFLLVAVVVLAACSEPEEPGYPHEIVASIEMSGFINDVCVLPSGDEALVCCEMIDSLFVVDLDSRSIERKIPLPSPPHSVSIHPYSELAFVSMGEIDSIAVVSMTADSMICCIPVADGSRDILALPDGSLVFSVSNYYPSTIDIIDANSLTVVNRIELSWAEQAMASSPTGDRVYVACDSGAGALVVLETNPPEILQTVLVDHPTGLDISHDGECLYLNGRSLYLLRTSDCTVIDSLSADIAVGQIAVSPFGEYLYAPSFNPPGYGVSIIDLEMLSMAGTVDDLPGNPAIIASSPTRDEVYLGCITHLFVLGP